MPKREQKHIVEKLKVGLKPYSFRPEKIQQLLDEKLMNIAVLSEICGMNQAGLFRVLKDGSQPRADTIGKIAAALGVKPGHFFDRD